MTFARAPTPAGAKATVDENQAYECDDLGAASLGRLAGSGFEQAHVQGNGFLGAPGTPGRSRMERA